VLDLVGVPIDDELIGAWRTRVLRAGAHLGWANREAVARRHAAGVSLAIADLSITIQLLSLLRRGSLLAMSGGIP